MANYGIGRVLHGLCEKGPGAAARAVGADAPRSRELSALSQRPPATP